MNLNQNVTTIANDIDNWVAAKWTLLLIHCMFTITLKAFIIMFIIWIIQTRKQT